MSGFLEIFREAGTSMPRSSWQPYREWKRQLDALTADDDARPTPDPHDLLAGRFGQPRWTIAADPNRPKPPPTITYNSN